MIRKLTWNEDLTVGVDAIDVQHKDIIDRINALREAMGRGQGGTEVGGLIAFLDVFVADHFGMEEVLMKRKRYDGYLAHRQEHINFTTEYTVKKKQYEKLEAEGGILSFFAVELERWLSGWLETHIATVDRAFGEFLMRPQPRRDAGGRPA